jgi:hypothetical protein
MLGEEATKCRVLEAVEWVLEAVAWVLGAVAWVLEAVAVVLEAVAGVLEAEKVVVTPPKQKHSAIQVSECWCKQYMTASTGATTGHHSAPRISRCTKESMNGCYQVRT